MKTANYFVFQNNTWVGPISLPQLNDLYQKGKITDDTLVKAKGGTPQLAYEVVGDQASAPQVTARPPGHVAQHGSSQAVPVPASAGVSSPSLYGQPWPNLRLIAEKQKFLIWTMLAGLVLEIPIMLAATIVPELGLPLALLYLAFRITVAMQLGNVAFQESVFGVFLALLTLFPCLGLIALLVINGKATSVLTSHGVKVGLMGADPRSIP